MTDWSMYNELGGGLWDDVRENDDNIVPRTGIQLWSEFSDKSRFCEKNVDGKSVADDGIQGREGSGYTSVKDGTASMVENNSWSSSANGDCLYSGDSGLVKEISGLPSNDARMSDTYLKSNKTGSSTNEFCEDGTFGIGATAYNNSQWFQLGDISSVGNNLNFVAEEDEAKDGNSFSDYGWADIGNLEEFDRIFRSCDPITLGQEKYSNEFGHSWFLSSSQANDGYEDHRTGVSSLMPDYESTLKHYERSAEFMFNNLATTNSNEQNLLDASMMNSSTPSADGFDSRDHCYHDLLDIDVEEMVASVSNKQARGLSGGEELNMIPGSSTSSEYGGMINLQSNMQRQSEGQKEDQSSEYLNDRSLHGPATSEKLEDRKLPSFMSLSKQEFLSPTISHHEDSVVKLAQAKFIDQLPVNKKLHRNHPVVGGDSRVLEKPGSSTVLKSAGVSTLSHDVSLEASSLRHLQCAMKQLDIRTKLCIRDSLYRLAKSAEQRHNLGYLNSSSKDSIDEKGLLKTEEANESLRFIDLEADTNPIDRSVANLLFQSQPDQVTRPSHEAG